MNSLRNTELALFFLLALFGISVTWKVAARDTGIDFYQFWAVGQALGRPGVTNIYSDADRARLGAEFLEEAKRGENRRLAAVAEYRKEFETYSSPFLYAAFRALSSGNYETDFRNYRLLLLACLVIAVVMLARLTGHAWSTTLGAVAVFSAWFPAFSSDLRVGNVNSLQLAALAIYLWTVTRLRWRHREILGGAILGLALAFKPNVAFVGGALAVRWIVDREMGRLLRHAIGGAAAGVLAVVLASASFGSSNCWKHWLAAMRSLPADIITVDLGNFAPARLIGDQIGFNPSLVLGILFAGAVLATMIRTRRTPGSRAGSPAAIPDALVEGLPLSIGCLLLLLIPQLAWLHYFVFTIPMLLILLRPLGAASSERGAIVWRRILPAFALLTLAVEPVQNIGVEITAGTAGVMIGFSALILLAGGLRELALVRSGDRQAERR
jgi:hypothetical protein